MKKLLLSALILVSLSSSAADTTKVKRAFYFTWGYTRAWYTKSDIHLKDVSGKYHPATGKYANYDFTLYDAQAHDQSDFDKLKDVINITIPQFVCRGGLRMNDKWDLEINYDHTKYVMTYNQTLRISGQIDGRPVSGDTLVDHSKFLHFEHTDGANFWMFNAVRKFKIWQPIPQLRFSWVAKAGAGIVFPRTDITLFGERLNNDWHVAGYIGGVESGLRIQYLKRGFFEFVGKGSFANYTNALVLGKGNGRANHHFFAGQLTMTLGMEFNRPK